MTHIQIHHIISLRAEQPVSPTAGAFLSQQRPMNIFFLSMSPKEAAKFHANIHVVKMIAAWLKADIQPKVLEVKQEVQIRSCE